MRWAMGGSEDPIEGKFRIKPLEIEKGGKGKGDVRRYACFKNLVRQVLKDQRTSGLQKLVHRKSYLEGEPLELLSHLALEAGKYTVSWNLLDERYENHRLLVKTYMLQLLDLPPCAPKEVNSIKKLLDGMREVLQNLRIAKVDIQYCFP